MRMRVSAIPLSRKAIREYARYIRSQLNIEDQLFFPIVEIIESLAIDSNVDFDYEVVPDSELKTEYGTTNTAKNVIVIRQSVYDGAVNGNQRDRFTLCHEFGHWLIHQPENISFARGDIPKYCDPEWQANVFAAELMVPDYLVRDMSIEDVVKECGVSYTCAEIQLRCYGKTLT